uniref:Protein PML n=1 Tax=Calidris pygmaea TaxID=425635 RepID=A0A8C3IZT0_9CHAR
MRVWGQGGLCVGLRQSSPASAPRSSASPPGSHGAPTQYPPPSLGGDGTAVPLEVGPQLGTPPRSSPSHPPAAEDDFQFLCCEGCRKESPNLKLLTCLHTLCLGCLSEMKPVGQCPICRTAIPQASGIPDMDNLLFTNLQARLSIYKKISEGGGPSCSRCQGETAAVWCSECEELLCTKCFDDHQWFFKKRSHEAKKVEELRADSARRFLEDTRKSSNLFCSRCSRFPSSIYCRTCKRALCCSCALLDSHHATFCDIVSETQRRQEELGTMRRRLQQKRRGLELARELERVEGVLRRMEAGERLVEKMNLYATEQEVMDMQPFIKDSLEELQRLQPPAVGDRTQPGDLPCQTPTAQALGHARVLGCSSLVPLLRMFLPLPGSPWGHSSPAGGSLSSRFTLTLLQRLAHLHHQPQEHAHELGKNYPGQAGAFGDQEMSPQHLTPPPSPCSPLSRLSPSPHGPSGCHPAWKGAARCHPSSLHSLGTGGWGTERGTPKYLLQPHPFPSTAHQIMEVAAVNGEHNFKTLIQTPESVLTLFSQGVSMEVGMQNLLWYLSLTPRPILIIYNFWAPELPALFKALDATGRKEDFCRVVAGYVDMLSLMKEKLPKAPSYRLKNLLRRHLQQQLNEASALAMAKALQDLWGVLELPVQPAGGLVLSHCNLQSYTILRPLVQEKLLTRRVAKILAQRNIILWELEKSERGGGMKRSSGWLQVGWEKDMVKVSSPRGCGRHCGAWKNGWWLWWGEHDPPSSGSPPRNKQWPRHNWSTGAGCWPARQGLPYLGIVVLLPPGQTQHRPAAYQE